MTYNGQRDKKNGVRKDDRESFWSHVGEARRQRTKLAASPRRYLDKAAQPLLLNSTTRSSMYRATSTLALPPILHHQQASAAAFHISLQHLARSRPPDRLQRATMAAAGPAAGPQPSRLARSPCCSFVLSRFSSSFTTKCTCNIFSGCRSRRGGHCLPASPQARLATSASHGAVGRCWPWPLTHTLQTISTCPWSRLADASVQRSRRRSLPPRSTTARTATTARAISPSPGIHRLLRLPRA